MTLFSIGLVTIDDNFLLRANLTTSSMEFNILPTLFIEGEPNFIFLFNFIS